MNENIREISTIKHPNTFLRSLPPGFDGAFDWAWLIECFKGTKVTPSDIDAVVERKGFFLVFETKSPGVEVPIGQMITLRRLYEIGCFSICIIHGKTEPVSFEFWLCKEMGGGVFSEKRGKIKEKLYQYVKRWFEVANSLKRKAKIA